MTPEQFYAQYLPYARSVSQRTGLDPRLVLAQSALETGYGKSAPNMNFFGIKSHGRKGGSTLGTQEFEGGRMVQQPASFRGYETPEQSFADYGDFITSNPRYKGVLEADGLEAQIAAMAKSGYATDPNYGSKLASIASRFDPNSPKVIAAETMSLLGKGPQTSTKGPQMMQQEQKPRGLLGSLGIQKMEEGAEGETGQRFYNRDSFKDTAATLAQGFGRMGIMGMEEIADSVAKQRTEVKARNKTIEMLRKMPNGEELVKLAEVMGPAAVAKQVLAQRFAKPKDDRTAAMQNYAEYQRLHAEKGKEAADQFYAMSKGGPTFNMGDQLPAESKLKEKLFSKQGENFASYLDAGANSAAAMQDLNVLQELTPLAPSGPVVGRLAEMFPEASDVAAVRQSIIKRVAPTLRVEGSGATSDLEFNAMLSSLGSLKNSPEANLAITSVMQEKARYNMQRRDIINAYMTDGATLADTNAKLAALDANSQIPSAVQSILSSYGADPDATAESSGATEIDGYKIKKR